MTRVALLLASLAFAGSALCQTYPNRSVKVVVPWPPGQATDLAARIVADKLSQSLAQPFVIENKPGAGGQIGTEQAVKSAPDGYTLLALRAGRSRSCLTCRRVPTTRLKDLAPISLIALTPFALVVHPSFPAANAKEFIALVRANPDKYTFSSSGTGATAHLFIELFNSMAQLKVRHVPYKGSAPALTDVISGQISYTLETVASTVGHIRSGRLKTLGVSTARRTAALPDVPPLAEVADLPGYDTAGWIGYAAPAGTPREIQVRLAAEIQKALQAPDLRERYVALGMDPVWNTPDEMART
jgi:tripartite-type tricarboxylate transporter receptor subunit TctC